MTTAPNPRLKSLPATPNTPQAANPAAVRMTGGEPKGVAEGVRSAVLPGPHTVTVTGIHPGLSVRGLGRTRSPRPTGSAPAATTNAPGAATASPT